MDFRLKDFAYPLAILKFHNELRSAENKNAESLVAYQEAKLKKIILQAYSHVPYYHRVFKQSGLSPDDIRTVRDLQKLPVLTKDMVREHGPDLVATNYLKYSPQLLSTSGSTGTPLQFYGDRFARIARFACLWRGWEWGGYRAYDRWVRFCGMVLPEGQLWKKSRILNGMHIPSFAVTSSTVEKVLSEIENYGPKIIRGYPSALVQFIHLVENRERLTVLGVKSILTDSETLIDNDRALIQAAFNCRVHDTYHQWESVCMISECEHQRKHHQMEYGVLELLDKDNKPVADGELGEITATGLHNYAMPLIRYKTRDLAIRSNSPCSCGRNHTVIERIDGRIEDMVRTPDGRVVGRLDQPFKYERGITMAQIVQNEVSSITVKLVRGPDYQEGYLNRLEKHLRDRLGDKIGISFQFVESIEVGSNGKRRLVVSKI